MDRILEHAFRTLGERVRSAAHIILGTHERADADAIGSCIAFGESIAHPGVTIEALAPETVIDSFGYLEGVGTIVADAARVHVDRADLVVLFDCGDVKRTHLTEQLRLLGEHRPYVALIDHHPSMTTYRGVNFVDLPIVRTETSSTCELVYAYYRANGLRLTPRTATALLAGIVTDTSGFQNLGTTLESMEVAGELLKAGGNLRRVVGATMRNKTVGILQLWGRALSRLELDASTGIVSTALMRSDFEECGVTRDQAEGIASFLNGLNEGTAVLLLREDVEGVVKGSYRTKNPDVNVADLAKRYGGGGHVKAAGFTVSGTIERSTSGWSVVPAPSHVATAA